MSDERRDKNKADWTEMEKITKKQNSFAAFYSDLPTG